MAPGEGRRASWRCPGCSALAVNSSVVREALGTEQFNEIWQNLRGGEESGIGCPECGHSMNETRVDDTRLEGCQVCTLIWFEAGEWEKALTDTPGSENLTRKLTEEEMLKVLEAWRKTRLDTEPEEAGLLERLLLPPSPRGQLLRVWALG